MTEISPDTQDVLEAKHKAAVAQAVLESMHKVNKDSQGLNNLLAAAALRAAVNQVLPENVNPVGDLHDDARHDQWMRIRYKFLALAAEMEGKNDY